MAGFGTKPPLSGANAKLSSPRSNIFLYLVAFRICNALILQTFFQPDEYFQSLEPAWQLAFGSDSGAWITWEWREQLRSSLIPFLFAGNYRAVSLLANLLHLGAHWHAELLVVAPKVLQSVSAALIDYFTYKLAQKLFPQNRHVPSAVLVLTVCSPWQFFCSTRTLANGIETALTSVALYLWPGHDITKVYREESRPLWDWRLAIVLAAIATILRPTNVIIWVVVSVATLLPDQELSTTQILQTILDFSRELARCGLAVIALSVLADHAFYGQWAFPPFRFLYFNVVQSLAVFYGRNRPDYYITEGLPLLCTTTLPFALVGLWKGLRAGLKRKPADTATSSVTNGIVRPALAASVLTMIGALSLIAHKEVRFIYPLLPILHIQAGEQLVIWFGPLSHIQSRTKQSFLLFLLAINVVLAGYVSLVHQRGVIDAVHYIRHEYERQYLPLKAGNGLSKARPEMKVGFFMPCHSTPWRSHLVYPGINAWALACEPPLGLSIEQRPFYRDEADQFYDEPEHWIERNMEATAAIKAIESAGSQNAAAQVSAGTSQQAGLYARPWPHYLVFFEQLEPLMKDLLGQSTYRQCWRGFNSHGHDDWRRKGDVIVWCRSDA